MPLLHLAAESGFLSACDWLLRDRGFHVDDRSRDRATALHVACGRFGGDRVAAKVALLFCPRTHTHTPGRKKKPSRSYQTNPTF